jgi:hypothetical protein
MADDRGVDEEVERLRRERPESRKREPGDLAVIRASKSHDGSRTTAANVPLPAK